MSSRPKRKGQKRAIYEEDAESEQEAGPSEKRSDKASNKRQATAEGKPGSLEWMLSSAKSPLCTIDMSKIINEDTWVCLSQQDREDLSALLPPTVYPFFEPTLPVYHPSVQSSDSQVDPMLEEPSQTMQLDGIEAQPSAFMNCPFFDSALITFQDHLYSGWFTNKHLEDVRRYQAGIQNATLHAPWKDDVWEQRQPTEADAAESSSRNLARNSLGRMVQYGLMAAGDIIVYRRTFPELGSLVVEKDVLVRNHWQESISVVAPPKTVGALPLSMIMSEATAPTGVNLQQLSVHTPEELEAAILDMDERVPRDQRSGGNSWKRFSLWKWKPQLAEQFELLSSFQGEGNSVTFGTRGPREERGTLFYLRGSYLPNK